MTGQIEGEHRKPALQRPPDQVLVQTHMVVITMQDDQGAMGLGRAPYLHGHGKFIHLNTPQVLR